MDVHPQPHGYAKLVEKSAHVACRLLILGTRKSRESVFSRPTSLVGLQNSFQLRDNLLIRLSNLNLFQAPVKRSQKIGDKITALQKLVPLLVRQTQLQYFMRLQSLHQVPTRSDSANRLHA